MLVTSFQFTGGFTTTEPKRKSYCHSFWFWGKELKRRRFGRGSHILLILLCGGQTDQELTREIANFCREWGQGLTESHKLNPLPHIIALKSAALNVNPHFWILLQPVSRLKVTTASTALSMWAGAQKAESRASVCSHISAPTLGITACHANTEETWSWRTNRLTDGRLHRALPCVTRDSYELNATW